MGKTWNDHEVEQLLRRAVDRSVPDLLEQVSTAEVPTLLNTDGIVPPPRARRKRRWPMVAGLLVVLAALAGGTGLWTWFHPAVFLSIGDGPDVTMGINRFGYVTEVDGYGQQGEALLENLTLEGLEYQTALTALAGNLGRDGYLSQDELTLDVTGGGRYGLEVLRESRDTLDEYAALWQDGDSVQIPIPQATPSPSPSVPPSTSPSATPSSSPAPSPSGNAGTTVIPSAAPATPSVSGSVTASGNGAQHGHGTTNTAGYDAEACKAIALQHAGVSAADAVFTKTELDRDHGISYYELEFYTSSASYEYEISAVDGSVLSSDQESHPQASYTLDEAKSIALSDAGVSQSQAVFHKAEQDEDDGRLIYELEFQVGGVEYEYEIDASNGAILKSERD